MTSQLIHMMAELVVGDLKCLFSLRQFRLVGIDRHVSLLYECGLIFPILMGLMQENRSGLYGRSSDKPGVCRQKCW